MSVMISTAVRVSSHLPQNPVLVSCLLLQFLMDLPGRGSDLLLASAEDPPVDEKGPLWSGPGPSLP